jgi:hypothetical protein
MKTIFPLSFWPAFFVWLPTTLITLATVFIYQAYLVSPPRIVKPEVVLAQEAPSTQMYASFPRVLGESSFAITSQDSVPTLVTLYLTKNKSPMAPVAQDLVDIARSYAIDPLLLVAIAQCESNLGKKMPANCHNPFGWGIHSAGTLCFSTWQEGFEKVSEGLRQKYLDQGLQSPYEIMQKYNYDSWKERDGSWAKCVNKFLEDLQYLKD